MDVVVYSAKVGVGLGQMAIVNVIFSKCELEFDQHDHSFVVHGFILSSFQVFVV